MTNNSESNEVTPEKVSDFIQTNMMLLTEDQQLVNEACYTIVDALTRQEAGPGVTPLEEILKLVAENASNAYVGLV